MFNFKHKKTTEFFDLFMESAKYFYRCALIMEEVTQDGDKAEHKLQEIVTLEHEADLVNEKIIDHLNQTFITPIDREDIFALANGLDDGVDFLQGTLQRIVIYHAVVHSKQAVSKQTNLIVQATEEIVKIFSMLSAIRKNSAEILACTVKIGELESEGDHIYRHEIADLFDNVKDPIELIKWKDILEHLEDTLDHCEDLSDMIRGLVMKYA